MLDQDGRQWWDRDFLGVDVKKLLADYQVFLYSVAMCYIADSVPQTSSLESGPNH
ncbi:MAG: hypothetical protein SOX85_11405 [Lachnospiraceae bacterium]|nr:hypothetical protein [Lachnospiraceae bacterium]